MVAVYAADKYLAGLRPSEQVDFGNAALDEIPNPGTLLSIAQLVEWVYKEKLGIGKRLEVVQAVVAIF